MKMSWTPCILQRSNSFKTKPEWTGVAKSKSFVSETPPESPTVKENNDVRNFKFTIQFNNHNRGFSIIISFHWAPIVPRKHNLNLQKPAGDELTHLC